MSLVKVVNNRYETDYALNNLFTYCLKKKKDDKYLKNGCALCGGLGVNLYSLNSALHSMQLIKKAWNKEDGNQSHHFIISVYVIKKSNNLYQTIHNKNTHEISCSNLISWQISEILYLKGFQNIYFIHMDTSVVHIHFVFNSVNMNGYRLRNSKAFYDEILLCLKIDFSDLQWEANVIYE